MKNEKSKTFEIIIVILIIIGAILLYPFKVNINKNGDTTCSNLLGMKYSCDR